MLNEAPAYYRENGRKAPRPNARRLPPIGLRLVVGLLEAAQQLVAALDCRIERLLSRLGARPHGLQFLIDDRADLVEAAEAHALGVRGRRLGGHLDQRRLRPGILLVEALLLGELVGGQGDRQVADRKSVW